MKEQHFEITGRSERRLQKNEIFRKRLFSTYLLVGILNVIIVFCFSFYIYKSFSQNLIERAESQMVSARSMTSAKLGLFIKKIKLDFESFSENTMITDSSIVGVWVVEKNETKQIFGDHQAVPGIQNLKNKTFYPYKEDFVLSIKKGPKTFIWLFNHLSISELISDREGLGTSGEVYLVGTDSKIKSASRHLRDWKNLKIDNNSIRQALNHKSGVNIVRDYRRIRVVSAYAPFAYDEIRFVILSEIDLKEVLHPLKRILYLIYGLSGLLLIINLIFSIGFTRDMWKKLIRQNEEIDKLHKQIVKTDQENALQIFRVQENERERISFALHDSVGQYLTVLKWGLSKLKSAEKESAKQSDIEQLSNTCNDIILEIREISHDLMPTLIKDFGFCLAIKDYLEKQNLIGPLKLIYKYSQDLPETKYKRDFEINLYRIVQELYQNNIKHSQASLMEVELVNDQHKLVLIYTDDGIGMPKDKALPHSINYRAKLFGGVFERVNYDKGLKFVITFQTSDIIE